MPNDDEHTPPRGNAKRNTAYSEISDRELLERAADNAFFARKTVRDHAAHVARIPFIEEKLNLALRPLKPQARTSVERFAPAAIALVLFAWLVVYTTRTSSATVPEPSPRVQASR